VCESSDNGDSTDVKSGLVITLVDHSSRRIASGTAPGHAQLKGRRYRLGMLREQKHKSDDPLTLVRHDRVWRR
jgi:hypothetical protein